MSADRLKEGWDSINARLVALENEVFARHTALAAQAADADEKADIDDAMSGYKATFIAFRDSHRKLEAAETKQRAKESRR